MFTYEEEITNKIFGFLEGNITVQDFSSWAYNSEKLINVLGIDSYCKLISIDFSSIFAVQDIEDLIKEFYKTSKIGLNNEIVLWILQSMINGTYDLVKGCSSLARLRSFEKGFKYLPAEFVGLDSIIEDLVYHYKNDKDNPEIERVIGAYTKEIFRIANEFLKRVNKDTSILNNN